MNKKAPTFSSGKMPYPSFGFMHLTGNKGWDYLILGTVSVIVLAFIIYEILMWSATSSQIQYTPADVVYGEKIHAVHDMGFGSKSQQSGSSPASSAVKSEIRLSEQFYDFGDVNPQQVLTRTFVIANSGQAPLIILRAYTTCGCTVADLTASVIPPGKVILMTVQFDPTYHDLRGTTVRRGVMIETNDPDHPIQEIWIQASVR